MVIVLDLAILAVIGIVGGLMGSMVGLAGGFLFVPALSFMGYPPYMVASTSLFAACTNASTSSSVYAKKKLLTYSLALKLIVFAVPGTVIGAYIADSISMEHFKLIFAIVTLVVTGITLLRDRLKKNQNIIESTEAVKNLKGVKSHN